MKKMTKSVVKPITTMMTITRLHRENGLLREQLAVFEQDRELLNMEIQRLSRILLSLPQGSK